MYRTQAPSSVTMRAAHAWLFWLREQGGGGDGFEPGLCHLPVMGPPLPGTKLQSAVPPSPLHSDLTPRHAGHPSAPRISCVHTPRAFAHAIPSTKNAVLLPRGLPSGTRPCLIHTEKPSLIPWGL